MTANLLGTRFIVPPHPEDETALEDFFSLRSSSFLAHLRFAHPLLLQNVISLAMAASCETAVDVKAALDRHLLALRSAANLPTLTVESIEALDSTGVFMDYYLQYPANAQESLRHVHPVDLAAFLHLCIDEGHLDVAWLQSALQSCRDPAELQAPLPLLCPPELMLDKDIYPRRISIVAPHRQWLPACLLLRVIAAALKEHRATASSTDVFLHSLLPRRVRPEIVPLSPFPMSHLDSLASLHPFDLAALIAHLILHHIISEVWVQTHIAAILTRQSHARAVARKMTGVPQSSSKRMKY